MISAVALTSLLLTQQVVLYSSFPKNIGINLSNRKITESVEQTIQNVAEKAKKIDIKAALKALEPYKELKSFEGGLSAGALWSATYYGRKEVSMLFQAKDIQDDSLVLMLTQNPQSTGVALEEGEVFAEISGVKWHESKGFYMGDIIVHGKMPVQCPPKMKQKQVQASGTVKIYPRANGPFVGRWALMDISISAPMYGGHCEEVLSIEKLRYVIWNTLSNGDLEMLTEKMKNEFGAIEDELHRRIDAELQAVKGHEEFTAKVLSAKEKLHTIANNLIELQKTFESSASNKYGAPTKKVLDTVFALYGAIEGFKSMVTSNK